MTIVEMVKGFQKAGRVDRINQLVDSLNEQVILPLNDQAAVIAGQIYGELERIGQPIGYADPLIAAIAIHHDLVLVTGNTQHFSRISNLGFDLRLDDWRN